MTGAIFLPLTENIVSRLGIACVCGMVLYGGGVACGWGWVESVEVVVCVAVGVVYALM